MPLKIDPLTLSLYQGQYARVLVDINMKNPLLERIIVKLQDENSGIDVSFYVMISYEKLPDFYAVCSTFNRSTEGCGGTSNASFNGHNIQNSSTWRGSVKDTMRHNVDERGVKHVEN